MNAPIAGQIRKVSPAAARVIQLAARRRQKPPAAPRLAVAQQPRESAFLRSLTTQERSIREAILRGDDLGDLIAVPVAIYEKLAEGDPAVERAVNRWAVQQRIRRRGVR